MSDTLSARSAKGGRIVLDTFRSAHDPMLQSWLRFRSQMLPDFESVPPARIDSDDDEHRRRRGGQHGVWRILASNNRELGRGATLHAAPVDALAYVQRMQSVADELQVDIVRGVLPMTHGWILRQEDSPVMTSPRWYESASEAGAASGTARTAFRSATIATSVSIGTRSGRRLRRSLDASQP